MMDEKGRFERLLAEFGSGMGEHLELKEGSCAIMVDGEVVVNIQYLDDSEMVLLWSSVGVLPEDGRSVERARFLLEKNDFWQETFGFTIGMDMGERRVLCHDIQSVQMIGSQDILAAWIETLVEVTGALRQEIAEYYPCDEELDND